MNIIDAMVIAVLALAIIIGIYQSFSIALASFISYCISWLGAISLGPRLSSFLYNQTEIYNRVVYFTDGGSKVSAVADRSLLVSALDVTKAEQLVADAKLPVPFGEITLDNLLNQRLPGLSTVSQYFEASVANILLNVLCFIIVFLLIWLAFVIALSYVKYAFELPRVKRVDWLASGAVGFLKGLVICYFVFAAIPLVSVVMSLPAQITEMIEASTFAPIFIQNNIVTYFVSGMIT